MWLFDLARGTTESSFKEGRFYVNGAGQTFHCQRVYGEQAILRLFHSSVAGNLMADIVMHTAQSSMHLEVTGAAENERLRLRLMVHTRNRGKRVSPDEIGLKMVDGPEGSYVMARVAKQVTIRAEDPGAKK
jgi:hypothetical protein